MNKFFFITALITAWSLNGSSAYSDKNATRNHMIRSEIDTQNNTTHLIINHGNARIISWQQLRFKAKKYSDTLAYFRGIDEQGDTLASIIIAKNKAFFFLPVLAMITTNEGMRAYQPQQKKIENPITLHGTENWSSTTWCVKDTQQVDVFVEHQNTVPQNPKIALEN